MTSSRHDHAHVRAPVTLPPGVDGEELRVNDLLGYPIFIAAEDLVNISPDLCKDDHDAKDGQKGYVELE